MSAPSRAPDAALAYPISLPSADPTVSEVVGLFLSVEASKEKREAKRACKESAVILERFAAAHGHLHLSRCKKAVLKLWIDGNPRLKSDWSRGNYCKAVQRCFNWAMNDMELVARNPFRGVRYKTGKRGRPLTDAEFEAMLGAAGPVFAPVLHFCRLSGARPGEMAAACWEHIGGDLVTGRAWITLTEHKTAHHENAKSRVVAMPRSLVELLVSLKPGEGNIFLNRRGNAWTRHSLSSRIRRLRKKLNLPPDAKLHGCRHAFATRAVINHVDLKDLAELLGHASTRMTEYYITLAGMNERLCDLADKATATSLR